ncbi:hypothetical protein [Flavobacterium difficile]|uniref:DUF4252 domain-containing protein n=1 Tax=Flavobacterium difficile TaxID=2709659 RepID=A0ABX0I799_9FLAO|nr:hypothetical protein [Flavobacterium difficile]NHM02561.1 hypothetical protein [Flavobacterium difficile]
MKIKVTILFVLASVFGFSQTLESMKIEVQKIYNLTIEKKYDIVLESTYPKVFEIASKSDMIAVMNQMFDNEQMKITIEKVNPEFTFSEILSIKGAKYCIVEHKNRMTMKFKEALGENKEFILTNLKENMTDYTVTLDEKTEVFTVDGKAKMIAISDKLTNGTWKYINYNGESPMMQQVLGKDVLEKLGL